MGSRARIPCISSGAVRKMAAGLEAVGVDAREVFDEAGLEPSSVADPDGRVPIAILHALWDATLRRVPRADGALLSAMLYVPGDYGLVGFVAMNCATLGEGLAHVVRYVGLWTDDPAMHLNDDGALAIVYRTRFADSPGLRMATEAAPAEVLQGARLLTQTALAPVEVCFEHPAPDDVSAHEAFFAAPVRFGQPRALLRFSREQLALPLPRADAQLGDFLRKLANDALARRAGPAQTTDQLRETIAHALSSGVPSIGQVSRAMGTSERTLRRRLEESGTSFRELLDRTRAELADGYVRDERVPLSEVAFLLGFSEASAFHRAFKRWTGATPSGFRRANKQG